MCSPDLSREALEHQIQSILQEESSPAGRLSGICHLLREQVPHYDWVGFYIVAPDEPNMLILGPYAGEPTDHVRIPFGRGICGQAAERGEAFVVQDVSQATNYLSCSVKVRSEIVYPIFRDGRLVGELDIDSHVVSPFTGADHALFERVCELVADLIQHISPQLLLQSGTGDSP